MISLAKLPPRVMTNTSDFRHTRKSSAARLVTCFLKDSISSLLARSSLLTCSCQRIGQLLLEQYDRLFSGSFYKFHKSTMVMITYSFERVLHSVFVYILNIKERGKKGMRKLQRHLPDWGTYSSGVPFECFHHIPALMQHISEFPSYTPLHAK